MKTSVFCVVDNGGDDNTAAVAGGIVGAVLVVVIIIVVVVVVVVLRRRRSRSSRFYTFLLFILLSIFSFNKIKYLFLAILLNYHMMTVAQLGLKQNIDENSLNITNMLVELTRVERCFPHALLFGYSCICFLTV